MSFSRIKKRKTLYFLAFLALTGVVFLSFKNLFFDKGQVKDSVAPHNESTTPQQHKDLVIPTRESILSNHEYPKNENGETYGPNMGNDLLMTPDLELVEGEDGALGYVRQPEGISSPSEQADYDPPKSSPVYLQDGKTIIGTFHH